MSQVCNRFLPIDNIRELAKKNSIVGAVRSQYLAWSELALLFQEIETRSFGAQSLAHGRTGIRYLNNAIFELDNALASVEGAVPTQEVMAWVKNFDFLRFFNEKVQTGEMPNRPDLWEVIVKDTLEGKAANSALSLRNYLAQVRDTLQSLLEKFTEPERVMTLVRNCVVNMSEASTLGIMMATLNDVKPLDMSWVKLEDIDVELTPWNDSFRRLS